MCVWCNWELICFKLKASWEEAGYWRPEEIKICPVFKKIIMGDL